MPPVVHVPIPTATMIELAPNLPQFRRSGRWTESDSGSGSLIASWASASISFIITSSSLSIRLGPQTKRNHPIGRSLTTLACSLSDDPTGSNHPAVPTQTLTFSDAGPGVLPLFGRLEDGQRKLVEIILVDWSSVLELVSIVVDSADAIQPRPDPSPASRLLFIGDSISCGFSPLPGLIPRGSLDAFTAISAAQLGLPYDIVAFPGIILVDPRAGGVSLIRDVPGMASRFFLAGSSPFEVTPAQLDERPTIIVIALGWFLPTRPCLAVPHNVRTSFDSPHTGTNDRGTGVDSPLFVETMRAFVRRLADVYCETLAHVCVLHAFPSFGMQFRPEFADAFSQIREQVSLDHPSLGVHIWNLGNALDQSLVIDRLHPNVQGHISLANALVARLRPLVAGE
ncbi:hypothetical protein BC826DRAFT_154242 [Russula brevipes]|nr:hypothetical protein BC826DRAFT_154242 [Russula brevipes]